MKKKMLEVSSILSKRAINEARIDERITIFFEKNDVYKICYRFISNMLSEWKGLELEHFPTKEEAIEIALKAHPYFVWLFKSDDKLDEFKRLYDFHEDIWKDNI